MKKIIAICGVPGTGKTTLMRRLIAEGQFEFVEPMKLLPSLYDKNSDLYILGKYDNDEVFAGTDKLSMAVQPVAEKFVSETTSNVMFEGDRLTTYKFFDHLLIVDAELAIIVLSANSSTLDSRYQDRGSNQSEQFLKGRESKISTITTNFDYMDYVTEFSNETLEDQDKIVAFIREFLGK